MNLGELHQKLIVNDDDDFVNSITAFKEAVNRMGDQVNDAYWDRDKRIQLSSETYKDTRSIILKWVDPDQTVDSPVYTIDYTALGLGELTYKIANYIVKSSGIPKGIEADSKAKILRLFISKIKTGNAVPSHLIDGDFSNIRRFIIVTQGDLNCSLNVDEKETSMIDGLSVELNTELEYSIQNNSSNDLIYIVLDFVNTDPAI